MKKIYSFLFPALITLFLSGGMALHAGYIGYIYPAGAKCGERVTITVAGQFLWGITSARVTGGGVTVENVETIHGFNHPYSAQRRYVVKCFQARKNNRPLPSMPLDFSEWRPNHYYDHFELLSEEKLDFAIEDFYAVRNSLQSSPSISHRLLVTLKVDENAKPGRRELRLCGRNRITNALPFFIGTAPEVREKIFELPPAKAGIASFQIPTTLHGQILPGGERDRFHFRAKKGEKITFRVRARELVPFMGDCVPGHFQPILEIFEGKATQKSLAVADYNYASPDPVLLFTAPREGDYTLTIRDSLHRGRKDFVYLVEVKKGQEKAPAVKAPAFPIPKAKQDKLASTPIKAPLMIEGVIAQKREKHTFTIQGKKGETRIFKVYARELGSPLDSLLILRDEDGKLLAKNDDRKEEALLGTLHHKADSEFIFTFPEDGKYSLTLSDTAANGSKKHFYFLRIDKPRPDFEVVLAPSGLYIAPWNGNTPLTFTVIPKEGFSAPVTFEFSTTHFFFTGTDTLPAGVKEGTLTAGARIDKKHPNRGVIPFQIRAKSGKIVKNVIPADKAMQAFAYTHFVPASEFVGAKVNRINGNGKFSFRGALIPPPKVKVNKKMRRRPPPPPVRYQTVRELKIPAGKSKELTATAYWLQNDATYFFRLVDPVKGVTIGKTKFVKKERGIDVSKAAIHVAKDVKKGKYLLQLETVYEYDSGPDANGEIPRRQYPSPMPTLLLEVQ